MDSTRPWNVLSIAIFVWFAYHLCAAQNIDVQNGGSDNGSSVVAGAIEPSNIWSDLLEELTTNSSAVRESRGYKYIPTSNIYINKRIGNVVPLGASALKQNINFNGPIGAPSGPMINVPMGGPSGPMLNAPPTPIFNGRITQNGQEISETDLYLLSAIEKLVYRVDYMEQRLRKAEQIVYYLMAGNNEHQKEILDKPCPMNFTRVGDNCYLIVTSQMSNWKTANNVCRSYGAYLAELDTVNENNDMAAYLLNRRHTFSSFWLGGLNPGLLWIWSTSARPVNPNVNLTQIHNSTHPTAAPTKASMKISPTKDGNKKITNTSTASGDANKKPQPTAKPDNELNIGGSGRCLALTYQAEKHAFKMYGMDCTSHQRFICELPQDHMDNEIDRIAKQLFH